jgi:hypothetical protein
MPSSPVIHCLSLPLAGSGKTLEERWPRINAKRTGPIEIDYIRLPLNPLDGI